MSSTLSDQLSSLGFRLLTSVLRTGFALNPAPETFAEAVKILQGWTDEKARVFGHSVDWTQEESKVADGDFRLDYVITETSLAILLEHPDPGRPERIWITEIAIETIDETPHFSTRLAFRQPKSVPLPEPRAPRYIAHLVTQIGAFDHDRLEPQLQVVSEDSLPVFLQLLLHNDRKLPIIAVSVDETAQWNLAPERLDRLLCGLAHVFMLESAASWALTRKCEELAYEESSEYPGKMFSVYEGAIRCYLPEFSFRSSPYDHRLWLPDAVVRANTRPNGFLNLCLSHTFAAAAAQFEVATLLTPATLRRRIQSQSRAVSVVPPTESIAVEQSEHPIDMPLAKMATSDIESILDAPAVLVEPPVIEVFPVAVRELDLAAVPSETTSAIRDRLVELEWEAQTRAAEIAGLRDHVARLETTAASAETALEAAWGQNDQLEQDLADLNVRFSAANQEISQLRQRVSDLETYKDLSEEQGQEIAIIKGVYTGRGDDPFARMGESLSAFVTAMQHAASSFKKYKEDADAKSQLEQELEEQKEELYRLRMQAESLKRRQVPEARERVELVLNDPDSLAGC